jgi:hypothetical protein
MSEDKRTHEIIGATMEVHGIRGFGHLVVVVYQDSNLCHL